MYPCLQDQVECQVHLLICWWRLTLTPKDLPYAGCYGHNNVVFATCFSTMLYPGITHCAMHIRPGRLSNVPRTSQWPPVGDVWGSQIAWICEEPHDALHNQTFQPLLHPLNPCTAHNIVACTRLPKEEFSSANPEEHTQSSTWIREAPLVWYAVTCTSIPTNAQLTRVLNPASTDASLQHPKPNLVVSTKQH